MINFSIIKKSQLEGAIRIDAEYYQPEYLEMFEKIKKLGFKKAIDVCDILRGNTPKEYGNYEIPIVRSGDLSYSFINDNENLLLAKKENIFFLQDKDILISSIGFGSIGKVNVFTNENNKFGTVSEVSVLRNCKISPYFMWAFLAGKFGQFQINREITGATGQLHLNTGNIENIIIPNENEFGKEVENFYKEAENLYKNSKSFYQQAEDLLLEELGLKDYEKIESLSTVINLSEVENAERMDAEYFQPAYTEVINRIEKYSGGCDYVKNQFKQNRELSKLDKEFYNYVEIGDVNIASGEIMPMRISLNDIPANGKIKLSKNDLLISKVRPYRGAVSIIDFEMDNLLGSGAFTVLQERAGYKKEVLMVFLKTIPIKNLLLRYNCGTSYPVIKDEDILNLKIPLLNKETQQKIADLVWRSHESRKKAKELLEEAKRKVEEMIEGKK